MNTERVREELIQHIGKQNGIAAALAVSVWAGIVLIAWFFLYQTFPKMAWIMIPGSATLLALVVRFVGRGYSGVFKALTYISFVLVTLMAWDMGVMIKGPVHGSVILALIFGGISCISFLSTISVSREHHLIFFRITKMDKDVPKPSLKNKAFVVLPLGLFGVSCSLIVALVALILSGFLHVE
ncbi:hypothetical protein [Arsukibacterium sp.]|uniref:hypothetical protein n=1 Tax=Arsukibacterium sp. TaxID=1977258 RepID=UPI00299D8FAC|nr:hypothetical protein [Arsukibacterium sp.]MDX1539094.1 hypothetical protein [Arsukibacterium sp.]